MIKYTLFVVGALGLVVSPAVAQNKSVKIGFVSTFSGPTAAMGNDMRNSLEVALDHLGRKMGGIPVEVIYEDDQQKPEIGKQKTDKLIESDRVDFIVGYIWSNVLLASIRPAVAALQDISDHVKRQVHIRSQVSGAGLIYSRPHGKTIKRPPQWACI